MSLRVESFWCSSWGSTRTTWTFHEENMPPPALAIPFNNYYILCYYPDLRVEAREENCYKPTCMYSYQLPWCYSTYMGRGWASSAVGPWVGVGCDPPRVIWVDKETTRDTIPPFYPLFPSGSIYDSRSFISPLQWAPTPFHLL